jgi:hypothetical protein
VVGFAKSPSKYPGHSVVIKVTPNGEELWRQQPCGYAAAITSDGACQTYIAGYRCGDAVGVAVQRVAGPAPD